MKRNITLALLLIIIGNIGALDTDSYQFVDHLLGLRSPGEPELYEDGIVFTAPSTYRSVGIAFGHEGFSKVYWFQKLMAPRNAAPPLETGRRRRHQEDIFQDSGILFHAMTIPRGAREVEYRLIVNGLWTVDPLNPRQRLDKKTGLLLSVVELPEISRSQRMDSGPKGSVTFNYRAPPGEIVTVAGDFNGWDPFMYQLLESQPGLYSISLPLPSGSYCYMFYHRGQRNLDPINLSIAYTQYGEMVSQITIP